MSLKISIVTPSFRQAAFIETTLRSVAEQDYPHVEHIVIDGGSADGSKQIIESFADKLAYWISEPDNGQSHAINKGLAHVTGDVFNWLNADDEYTPGALSQVSAAFEAPETLAVCGRCRLFGEGYVDALSVGTDLYPDLAQTIGWARIDQPATFFRQSAITAMGPLPEDLRYCMDRAWWIRFLLLFGQKNVRKTDFTFVNFRLHPASKTVSEGNLFDAERNGIFYSLALQTGRKQVADVIVETGPVFKTDFFLPAGSDLELARRSLDYFLALRAMECYENGETAAFFQLYEAINFSTLNPVLQRNLAYLKFKLHVFPVSFLRFARKFTR